MAAILSENHDAPLMEAVVLARPAAVQYEPRQDIPKRLNETVFTITGSAAAMGILFFFLLR